VGIAALRSRRDPAAGHCFGIHAVRAAPAARRVVTRRGRGGRAGNDRAAGARHRPARGPARRGAATGAGQAGLRAGRSRWRAGRGRGHGVDELRADVPLVLQRADDRPGPAHSGATRRGAPGGGESRPDALRAVDEPDSDPPRRRAAPAPFSEVQTTRWPSTLYNPPTHAAHETVAVYLATVRPDGLAEPVVTPRS